MRQCNYCDRKHCKIPSRNFYPKMRNAPADDNDKLTYHCPVHVPFKSTMPLKEAARWTKL